MKVANLSRRPFVNERPVVRLTVALWLLGAALLALNIYYYSTYWWDSAETREELARVRETVREKKAGLDTLQDRFSDINLSDLNDQASFLNELIRNRTFPWSQLFDHLEEVLEPHYQVRLLSVQPDLEERKKRFSSRQREAATRRAREVRKASRKSSSGSSRSREEPPPPPPPPPRAEEVELQFQGISKSSDAILDFIDTLFAHPSFRHPDLRRENINEQTSQTSFDIAVVYLTGKRTDAGEEAAPAGGTVQQADEEAAEDEAEGDVAVDDDLPQADEDEDDESEIADQEAAGKATPAPAPPDARREERQRLAERRFDDQDQRSPRRVDPPASTPPAGRRDPARRDDPAADSRPGAVRIPRQGEPLVRTPAPPAGPPAAAGGTPAPPTQTIRRLPGTTRRMPPPPAAPTPPASTPPGSADDESDTRVSPRFVGPDASDAPRLRGGG